MIIAWIYSTPLQFISFLPSFLLNLLSGRYGIPTEPERKWNSNCYFNIYHPAFKSLESSPSAHRPDQWFNFWHNLPWKMPNVQLNASIFQDTSNHRAIGHRPPASLTNLRESIPLNDSDESHCRGSMGRAIWIRLARSLFETNSKSIVRWDGTIRQKLGDRNICN